MKMKRTKVFVTIVTIICMAVTMFPAYTFAEEATAENVIEIGTAAQLQDEAKKAYNNSVPKGTTYKLTADIDFSGFSYEWKTIAVPFGTKANPFCGTFDGNGHVIKNLTVGDSDYGPVGLFGGLGDGAVIKNLGMENTTVKNKPGNMAAVVAGCVSGNVTITDCYIRDTSYDIVTGGGEQVAGFVGAVNDGATLNITNCYVTGTKSAINNCMLRGEMFAWGDNKTETITLTSCYTDTNQLAPKLSTTSTTVTNCYANSEGLYKSWNIYGTEKWLGTAVAASELKLKATALGTGFKGNPSSSVNGGYPLLAWEPTESNVKNPTIISTKEELAAISKLGSTEGQYFKLANDIDLEGAVWTDIIGTEDNKFAGVFDGCGHVIKNFKIIIKSSSSKYNGLFGYVGQSAHILNLGVEDVTGELAAGRYGDSFGGIAGVVTDRAGITGCYVKNVTTIKTTQWNDGEIGFAGGMVGRISTEATAVEIRDCYSRGFSAASGSVNWRAGLIGLIDCNGVIIENCYSDTTLTAIVNNKTGTVNNSYCMDSIKREEANSSGTVVDEDTLKNSVDSLGSKKFVSGDDGYPVLKWTKSPGMYINLVQNGSITNEKYIFDNAEAKIIDGRNIESDKQAHKQQTPYCNRNSKVIKAKKITVPVTLEQGKYYRIAFSGLADLPDHLGNTDFSFKIGDDNIYDRLADKNLYYYSWQEKSVVYTPEVGGTYNLFISCGENMYVDDITVEVLDGKLESSIAADKLTLKYLAVDVVDNDIYLEPKTA
ncbi:MAG: hypothetical protein PUF72_01485, partial [Clostridiales bacterium]|nr:hypothetical protein [Clostridiales bacterium]